jgi:hypothetical protein
VWVPPNECHAASLLSVHCGGCSYGETAAAVCVFGERDV